MLRPVALVLCFVTAVGALAAETPQLLIAPLKKSKTALDPNLSIANYLAQEFDNDGRVLPVVWGFGDPVFRQAALDGRVKHGDESPTPKISQEAAQGLGAPYLLTYTTDRKNGALVGHAELRVFGKLAWKNDSQVTLTHGGDSPIDDEAESVARTWAVMLEGSVFHDLKPRPRKETPKFSPGQTPTQTPIQPVPTVTAPPVEPTSTALEDEVRGYEQKGQVSLALLKVRDAIDSKPMDPALRLLLVHMLERQGQLGEAANQAARAAELMPDNRELRMCAVRDMLAVGHSDQAREQLNEILARDPSDPASMLLQGQIYLELDRPDEAISSFDHLVQVAPSPAATYWRAVARAFLGGADGVARDAATYAKDPLGPDKAADTYTSAMDIWSSASKKEFDSTLTLFPQASAAGNTEAFRTALDQALRACEARVGFLSGFPPPASFKISHGKRLLAQKLLSVCLSDLQDFAKSNNEDVVTDARINLGEAMKQSKAADTEFAAERGQPKHDGHDPTHP